MDPESLTLALNNLLNSVISVLLIYNNYTVDLMNVLVGKIIFVSLKHNFIELLLTCQCGRTLVIICIIMPLLKHT